MSDIISYIAYINSTGEIVRLNFGKASNNPPHGYDSELNQTIIYITGDLPVPRDEYVRTYYWNGGAWTHRGERPNKACTWDGSSWVWESEDFLNLVRNTRTTLLNDVDWAVLPDAPFTEAEQTEIRNYRTALRDITTTTMPASGSINDVSWPTKPSCLG